MRNIFRIQVLNNMGYLIDKSSINNGLRIWLDPEFHGWGLDLESEQEKTVQKGVPENVIITFSEKLDMGLL